MKFGKNLYELLLHSGVMKKCIVLLAFLCVVFLFSDRVTAQSTTVQVLSAVEKDKVIEGAQVIFQKNGETSVNSYTDSHGKINIPSVFGGINDQSVTVIIKKDGFSTLVTKGPFNGMTYALSPSMQNLDGIRFVLNWGASPEDLDSHLSYPGNHVYFQSRSGSLSFLDVDDTNGYGPETITLSKKKQNQRYVYAVHNYTDKDKYGTTSLSSMSNCKVFVYIGNTLIRTYKVPENKTGNTWIVCSIDENGVFNTINEFCDLVSPQNVEEKLLTYQGNSSNGNDEIITQDQLSQAKSLNKSGEDAYHAGNLELSVQKYQQAIELDPYYGQAYSNLGLSFKKLGNVAESIWANRKAIDLANGQYKNVTQASSYYNIAKIYEEQGQWDDALQNYKKAKELKQHSAYDSGIQRMNEKLGIL